MPEDISLTQTGEIALWLTLIIIMYSGWRWSHLGHTFGKGRLKYFFLGIVVTILVVLVSFALSIGVSYVVFSGINTLSKSENDVMSILVFVFMLSIGYGVRWYFWKRFSKEGKDEIETIGTHE